MAENNAKHRPDAMAKWVACQSPVLGDWRIQTIVESNHLASLALIWPPVQFLMLRLQLHDQWPNLWHANKFPIYHVMVRGDLCAKFRIKYSHDHLRSISGQYDADLRKLHQLIGLWTHCLCHYYIILAWLVVLYRTVHAAFLRYERTLFQNATSTTPKDGLAMSMPTS